jgi:hypothetical protein
VRTARWLSATAFLAAAVPAAAQHLGAFSTQHLSQVDKTISSDAFQGRGPATPIEPTVINYIAAQLKAAGVQPGGDLVNGRRTWFQTVPLLESQIDGTPQISINENGTVVPLQQGPEMAVLAPLNGATRVDIENAPLVFVGYGVDAPERGWNDFKGQDMHGKVLVELVNDPDFEAAPGDPVAGKFGGKAMTYYGRWTYKYEEAARQGAAGVILIHETAPASYGWEVVQNSNTIPQFDIVRDNPAAEHSPFESWIQRPLAVQLFQRSGLDFEQARVAARSPDFRPIPLKATLTALFGNAAGHPEPQCRRHSSGQEVPGRDDHLLGALGPSRGRQARRDRRSHLQRRGRQRHRHCPADRAGAGLGARTEARPFGRVPRRNG